MEGAAGRQGAGARRLAADDRPLPQPVGGVRLRHRREQRPGVGVARVLDELARGRHLHDAPRVHHRDPVGGVARAGQVVGDGQHRQAARRAWRSRSRDRISARLEASIIGHRLVGHEEVGLRDHRPRDAHPLALAARERVRVAARRSPRRATARTCSSAAMTRASRSRAGHGAVDHERLRDQVARPACTG